jgi:hypothetical protein
MTEEKELDEVELVRCYLCQKYKPIKDTKLIRFRDLIRPKEICNECYGRATTEGLMGSGRDPAPKEQPKIQEEKP